MIKHKKGLERLCTFFTGQRQFRCRDCDEKFRAPDRRLLPRDNVPDRVRHVA
jgi:tRNA(Ile2) C34 agmatinyltransferase TiaS